MVYFVFASAMKLIHQHWLDVLICALKKTSHLCLTTILHLAISQNYAYLAKGKGSLLIVFGSTCNSAQTTFSYVW